MSELIAIDRIFPNPFQPRRDEDPAAVAELAESIQRNGLMQIPTARRVDGHYELAFGHTRLAAFVSLDGQGVEGYRNMPLNVAELTDLQMFELGVAENIKRKDLSPVEQAMAMRRYMDDFGKSSVECGEFFGVNDATVRGKVRLLDLPAEAQEKLRTGELSESSARKLLTVQRIAPKEVTQIIKEVGPAMSGTLDDAIEDVFRDNKKDVVMMWGRYQDDDEKARGGEFLWPLDWKPVGIEPLGMKDIRPIILNQGNQALTETRAEQMIALAGLLAAGTATTPEQYPDLNSNAVELILHLSNPPVCTACPMHAVVDGAHYCGEKRCWERKKEAWLNKDLKALSKKLGIAIYDPAKDRKPVDTYEHTWSSTDKDAVRFKAQLKARDPDLRITIRRLNEYHAYPGTEHHWIAIVTVSDKRAQLLTKQREAEKKQRVNNPYEAQQRQWKIEAQKRGASEAFIQKVAAPLFAPAFEGATNVPAFLAAIDRQPDQLKKFKKPEQIKRLQMILAEEALDGSVDYRELSKGPVATAKHLQGVATSWGVKLPADFEESAKDYEPAVSTETKKA